MLRAEIAMLRAEMAMLRPEIAMLRLEQRFLGARNLSVAELRFEAPAENAALVRAEQAVAVRQDAPMEGLPRVCTSGRRKWSRLCEAMIQRTSGGRHTTSACARRSTSGPEARPRRWRRVG